MTYRFWDEDRALNKLLARRPREQWALYELCAELARHPFVEPELKLRGDSVRPILVGVFGSTLVHYWVDHAINCVKIVDFEFVEDEPR